MTTQMEIVNKTLEKLGGRPPDSLKRVGYHRIILSWVLYWSGDIWYRATRWLGHWFEWPYKVYSWFMCKSDDLQSEDPRGPWGPVSP